MDVGKTGKKTMFGKFCSDADIMVFEFGQIPFAIWTNTFRNLDKYILHFEQIHFAI